MFKKIPNFLKGLRIGASGVWRYCGEGRGEGDVFFNSAKLANFMLLHSTLQCVVKPEKSDFPFIKIKYVKVLGTLSVFNTSIHVLKKLGVSKMSKNRGLWSVEVQQGGKKWGDVYSLTLQSLPISRFCIPLCIVRCQILLS